MAGVRRGTPRAGGARPRRDRDNRTMLIGARRHRGLPRTVVEPERSRGARTASEATLVRVAADPVRDSFATDLVGAVPTRLRYAVGGDGRAAVDLSSRVANRARWPLHRSAGLRDPQETSREARQRSLRSQVSDPRSSPRPRVSPTTSGWARRQQSARAQQAKRARTRRWRQPRSRRPIRSFSSPFG